MSFSSQYADAHDVAFIKRVEQAAVLAATQIASESTATVNHANRVALATQVLRAPASFAPVFATAVVADGTVTAASQDAALSSMIAAVWNGVAGVA